MVRQSVPLYEIALPRIRVFCFLVTLYLLDANILGVIGQSCTQSLEQVVVGRVPESQGVRMLLNSPKHLNNILGVSLWCLVAWPALPHIQPSAPPVLLFGALVCTHIARYGMHCLAARCCPDLS